MSTRPERLTTVERYHDFCAGHRVVGHESKCAHFHGHNYRVTFIVAGPIDKLGRVVDFGKLRALGEWLEREWDHRMLLWEGDPMLGPMLALDDHMMHHKLQRERGVVIVPFNPTAENLAEYLLFVVGPDVLEQIDANLRLVRVRVEETRKCASESALLLDVSA